VVFVVMDVEDLLKNTVLAFFCTEENTENLKIVCSLVRISNSWSQLRVTLRATVDY
jgi:hypothetical protein